jgi:soluble lytic murein transglycosylase-like protein
MLQSYFDDLEVMEQTLQVAYPWVSKYEARYYSHIFHDFSKQYGVDWTWYPAMIKVESHWNHMLISNKKARGLTQTIPKCAVAQAKRLNIRYKEGFTEWNEINNIVMGTDYFSQGFVKGSDYAVRRYIGGPGFKSANDTNQIKIDKYSKEVKNEQAKIDSLFQEHEKLFYISKGITSSLKR